MTVKYDNKDGRLRGRAGKARRQRIWALNPHCAECGKLTDWPAGFQIDHRIPLFKGGEDVDSNLQVLCSGQGGCHDRKTAIEKGAELAVSFFPEWLEPAACHLTIVFGPPGSGKSVYVESRARTHDVVIDLDLIISEMSRLPIYQAGKEWLLRGIYLRNRMLSHLKREKRPAWFMATGAGKEERDWWIAKLRPSDCVVLKTEASVCIARIKADVRRPPHVKARQIAAVRTWWIAETGQIKSADMRTQFDDEGRVVW